MPEEDRAWLEAALSHIAADSDPVKKLKRWMARLEEVGEPSEANLGDIGDILEEIGDLVCDMDMAQCFCSLNGISLIQRLLAKQFDPCSALLFHLVGVLAQYNQRVQQLLLHTTAFLSHCLDIIVDSERLVDYRHKCVGAISAMVKAHLPALIRFVELDGPDKLMRCFEDGVGMADNTKLAHRCAVAAVALKRSFSVEVVNIDSNFRRVAQCPAEMRAKLVDGDTKWNDTLEFLAE
uniref:TOG domain-containing protein n=1 Tax=Globodera pallida TaxID=36090 RepID=A0A183BKA5_GLOPA